MNGRGRCLQCGMCSQCYTAWRDRHGIGKHAESHECGHGYVAGGEGECYICYKRRTAVSVDGLPVKVDAATFLARFGSLTANKPPRLLPCDGCGEEKRTGPYGGGATRYMNLCIDCARQRIGKGAPRHTDEAIDLAEARGERRADRSVKFLWLSVGAGIACFVARVAWVLAEAFR